MPTYPDISKITLPTGSTYNVKDQTARDLIAALEKKGKYLGKTTTDISDNSTNNPITVVIDGTPTQVTAIEGDWAIYDKYDGQTMVGTIESIWNGTTWQEFGDLSDMGSLAYKDSASGSTTVAVPKTYTTITTTATTESKTVTSTGTTTGSVSVTKGIVDIKTKATGTEANKYTPSGSNASSSVSGSCTVTANGSVSTPTISLKTAGSTTTVNSITDVGTLPSATMPTYSVSNETLTITAGSFNAGTLPTKGSDTTVKTGDGAYQSSQPSFTGSSATGTISGTAAAQTFTGNDAYFETASNVATDASFVGASMTSSGSVDVPKTYTSSTTTATTENKDINITVS